MCCVDFEAVLRLESGNKQAHSELKMVQQMLKVRLKLAVTLKITAYFTYLDKVALTCTIHTYYYNNKTSYKYRNAQVGTGTQA